jgi:hypothetical protein
MQGGKGMEMKKEEEERMEKAPQGGEGEGLICRCSRFSPVFPNRSMFKPSFSAAC